MKKLFVKDKSFYHMLFAIALPIVAQNVITIGVNMMDTIMLGSFGEAQLSGSSLANEFINIFQILCMGMGNGAAVLTAQYWGARDKGNLKKSIAIMLRFALSIALAFTLFIVFIPDRIMAIYTNEADVIAKGIIYFRWSIPTFLMTGISLTLSQILRSVKEVKIPLYSSIASFFVNIFFNWVFIFGKLGMPRMEIAGAALGTVLARTVELIIVGGYVFAKDQKIGFRFRDIFMPTGDLQKKYFTYSLPVLASDSLLGFGNSAVAVVVGHMGASFTAAYAIVSMLQRLSTVFTAGLGAASHTMTGNRIGEGKTEQAYAEALTMLTISVLLGIGAGLLIFLLGPLALRFYNITEETKTIALQMMDAVSIMIVFQSMQSVITKGVLRGGGDTKYCLLIDGVFLWVVSVPLGYYTGIVRHMSAFIVFLSLKIDWPIKSILGTRRIISGKWIKQIA